MGWFWADSPNAPNRFPPHPVSASSATPPVGSNPLLVISRADCRKVWLPYACCRPLKLVKLVNIALRPLVSSQSTKGTSHNP